MHGAQISTGLGEVTAPGVGLSLPCISLQRDLACTAPMCSFCARLRAPVWF